ncbi:MAG: RnfABCDGE type electron transport complex subunit B [Clostridia bacterium]|nr:RnfABCDGE type electron transport complex subunit B [Clostridia bacterium]
MAAFISPVLLTVIVGLIAAVMLAVASKVMAVPVDETAVKIRACLPGANCGACGYAGCDDYAAALAADHSIRTNLCVPGADGVASMVAAALGQEALDVIEMVANVKCSGICDATKPEMDYQGMKSCAAVKGFFGGPGTCKYGCIGFGDCVNTCAYDAISVCEGVARVDRELCRGCGACAKACPQKIIALIPDIKRVHVECSSLDKGKVVTQACKAGCIGCKKCEKTCKFDAIHVENNLAVIDYDKCKNCGMCAKECPRHIIQVFKKANVKPIVKVDDAAAAQQA